MGERTMHARTCSLATNGTQNLITPTVGGHRGMPALKGQYQLLDAYDCVLVYSKISSSCKGLENNENKTRDAIEEYLADDDYKEYYTSTVKYFQVDAEVREGENGRTDIRFLQVIPYQGQKVYFTIECKRLDGTAFLSKEYVVHGIERFKDEKNMQRL